MRFNSGTNKERCMGNRKAEAKDTVFKIEDGIPIPPKRIVNNKGYSETLRKLKIGQSCVLPIKRAIASCLAIRILGKGKTTTRTIEGGTRVWRLE
jgi:hypothetical protein